MKLRLARHLSASLLIASLTLATAASAAPRDGRTPKDVREKIVRIVKSIQQFFSPAAQDENLIPPRP
jgi:hypothetical protein